MAENTLVVRTESLMQVLVIISTNNNNLVHGNSQEKNNKRKWESDWTLERLVSSKGLSTADGLFAKWLSKCPWLFHSEGINSATKAQGSQKMDKFS